MTFSVDLLINLVIYKTKIRTWKLLTWFEDIVACLAVNGILPFRQCAM